MNQARILICIPVRGRMDLAQPCIRTLMDSCHPKDCISVYFDGLATAPLPLGHLAYLYSSSIGIDAQRRVHFSDFEAKNAAGAGFTHLYLSDADAPHDPNWRTELLRLQALHGNAPICGYNTAAHSSLLGNTIEDDPASEVIWRRVAPGISYLLTAEHVAKVCAVLPHLPPVWHWDWQVPAILGHRFAVTRTSLVEHIGVGGLHHPENAGYDGGDRATNPTPWLAAKRAEIVRMLQ